MKVSRQGTLDNTSLPIDEQEEKLFKVISAHYDGFLNWRWTHPLNTSSWHTSCEMLRA